MLSVVDVLSSVVSASTNETAPSPSSSGLPRMPGAAQAAMKNTAASTAVPPPSPTLVMAAASAGMPTRRGADRRRSSFGLRLDAEPDCVCQYNDDDGRGEVAWPAGVTVAENGHADPDRGHHATDSRQRDREMYGRTRAGFRAEAVEELMNRYPARSLERPERRSDRSWER